MPPFSRRTVWDGCVPLLIRLYRNGQVIDERWRGTLTAAQDAYCQSVRDGILDELEIRDPNGELLFRYPVVREPFHWAANEAALPAVLGTA